MTISWIQPSFAGGEIGPSLYGRIDMSKYQVALRKCDNFIVRQYGGVENRPGTRFVGEAKYSNKKCRLIPFQFSTVQTYALEFGDGYMAGGHRCAGEIPAHFPASLRESGQCNADRLPVS